MRNWKLCSGIGLLTIWFLIYCEAVKGQEFRATEISLAEGLSQSSVYAVVQDQQGFTWLATQDGLNRYDGISFTVYREEPFDTQSVSSGNISALYCDPQGRLWVGTNGGGLNLFQPRTSTFRHLSRSGEGDPGRIINAIAGDRKGNIWIAADNGLFRMSDGARLINCPLRQYKGDTIPDKFVNTLFCDRDGNMWAGTLQGLFRISSASINSGLPVAEWHSTVGNVPVNCIAQDSRGNIWAGGRKGLHILSGTTTAVVNLLTGARMQKGMRSNIVNRLYLGSSGDMWVGYTEHGIQTANYTGLSDTITFTDVDALGLPSILSNGNCLSFFEDRITPGMIWAGFNAGGVVRLAPVTKRFNTDKLNHPSIPSPFVTSLVKDKNGMVWIATASGLVRKDPYEKKYTVLLPEKQLRDPGVENYVGGVTLSEGGEVLFTSGMKVLRSDASGTRCTPVPVANGESSYFRTLQRSADGSVYALTRYGILRYDEAERTLVPYLRISDAGRLKDKGFYVSCILHDSRGNIWVGTSAGLDFYAKGNLAVQPVTYIHDRKDTASLRSQTILSVYEDRDGTVWLGTMNGLSKVISKGNKHSFVNYSTHSGLSNNVIYSIIQDTRTRKLWVSTNNGLTLFDPDGEEAQVFDVHDGIQSNEFNSYAASVSVDGEIFFGGIAGYTSFYPEGISADTTSPRVSVTGITLANGRFIPFENAGVIDMKYRDNNFTVSFIALHYVDPAKNRYAYKLEGFQDDWIFVEGAPRVNFSQLPPGKYTFRVKASNSDGKFSTDDASVTINLLPPFYKTIWFFLLVVLFILGVLFALHRYRLQMKLEQIREIEKLRKATAADFHDELGHKLTIISWFAEILKKKIGPEQIELRPHLDKIIETSGNLYHTMKDMLWAMDPDKDSVFELYHQIRDFGQGLFDETGVMFEAEEVPESLRDKMVSPSQRRHVLLIFKEVMHNALKHSGSTETRLGLKAEDRRIELSFRDNGTGFKMNGQNVGHGLNNVKRRAQMIDADISILSEQGGTVAKLTLPLN